VFQGHVHKHGQLNKALQLRFFVLDDQALRYYKDEAEFAGNDTAYLGAMASQGLDVHIANEGSEKEGFAFTIRGKQLPQLHSRDMLCVVGSARERQAWKLAVLNASRVALSPSDFDVHHLLLRRQARPAATPAAVAATSVGISAHERQPNPPPHVYAVKDHPHLRHSWKQGFYRSDRPQLLRSMDTAVDSAEQHLRPHSHSAEKHVYTHVHTSNHPQDAHNHAQHTHNVSHEPHQPARSSNIHQHTA